MLLPSISSWGPRVCGVRIYSRNVRESIIPSGAAGSKAYHLVKVSSQKYSYKCGITQKNIVIFEPVC